MRSSTRSRCLPHCATRGGKVKGAYAAGRAHDEVVAVEGDPVVHGHQVVVVRVPFRVEPLAL